MKVALGSDHAGFALKERVKKFLASKGVEYSDFGTNSEKSVDYPDYGFAVARAVSRKEFDRGVLVCGTGIGMSIAANRVKGVRAAVGTSIEVARLSREHNDANVLCLPGRFMNEEAALKIVGEWLSTGFSGEERHYRRVRKIEEG